MLLLPAQRTMAPHCDFDRNLGIVYIRQCYGCRDIIVLSAINILPVAELTGMLSLMIRESALAEPFSEG